MSKWLFCVGYRYKWQWCGGDMLLCSSFYPHCRAESCDNPELFCWFWSANTLAFIRRASFVALRSTKKASFLCKLVTSSQKGSYDANWNIPESSDIRSWSEELCQHLQNSLRDGASVDCDSKKRGHSCIHCPVSFSTQFNPPTAMNVDCDLCKQSAQAKVVVAGPALEFGLQQTHRAVE